MQVSHLHTLAVESTGNAHLGAERDMSSTGPSGAPATRPPFPCQGASHVAPGKSGVHAHGEGERVIALESW